MADSSPVIVWFREDLRLRENPALSEAKKSGRPVICLYVRETNAELRPMGGASKWWLDKSLRSLASDITEAHGSLILRSGSAAQIIDALVDETGAQAVYWNRRYDEAGRNIDTDIKLSLKDRGIDAESFNARLLTEPWEVKTKTGGYYKVFTPYWKAIQAIYSPPGPLTTPKRLNGPILDSEAIDEWDLHPSRPDWSTGFSDKWSPGEAGAFERLNAFLDGPVASYPDDRNRPDLNGTSGLSPHLRFGEIGPAQIWRTVMDGIGAGRIDSDGAMKFLSEVVWREFSYVLLFHNPDLATKNYKKDFDHMPWRSDDEALEKWQKGQTGYPIVDAGMRELWATGWMHNRVRMIVASFLTKHLLLPWQLGEEWFWDTLVDADPGANAASWQWTAGSGADAAPYFRIFNPITQGAKFDETRAYVKRWVPEIAKLPDKYLYAPWDAPQKILDFANIKLGSHYPHPIVNHPDARNRALDAYDKLKHMR